MICVSDCEYHNNYQCSIDYYRPLHIKEKQLSLSVVFKQENIGFGFWMMYQPYYQMSAFVERDFQEIFDNKILTKSYFGQFLYSMTNKNSNQKLLIVSQELNQKDSIIVHKVFYNFTNGKKTIQFSFDIKEYEGQWILFYCYFNQLEAITQLGFYQSDLNILRSEVINDSPQLEDIIIHQNGGLQQYVNEDQQLIILNQFIGQFSCVLSAGESNFENSIFECSDTRDQDNCYEQKIKQNIDLIGLEFITINFYGLFTQKYYLSGWVRLNQIQEIELVTQMIRITINIDHGDDLYIGDRDLFIKYFQNINAQQNGFEISTYSYKFPQKGRYQTPEELKIKVLGSEYQLAIIKWHFIYYVIGTEFENKQPLYQVYFPNFNEIKQFRFPVQVQHFTGTQFFIFLGGDKYSKNYMRGQTYDLEIKYFCDEPNPVLVKTCHYSCFECFGPTIQNCLSCSINSFRVFSEQLNTCNCQFNYIDVDNQMICQQINEAFPQLFVEEIQLNCDIEGYDICDENYIQCSFGYFKNENFCIKCPSYGDIYSKITISCFDCFINPESFGQNLICTQEVQTFYKNQENSYQIIDKYDKYYDNDYYIIKQAENGQKYLQLCEGCTSTSCKVGYFKKNGECLKCSEGCWICLDVYACVKCDQELILAQNQICIEGDEMDVGSKSFCAKFNYQHYCDYCEGNSKLYFITFEGRTCDYCNIDNCQYCFQYSKIADQYFTTLDIQFRIYLDSSELEIRLGCALCEPNYYFNLNSNKCELKPEDNDCVFAIIEKNNNLKCIIGSTENDAIQVSDCSELKFCQQCVKNYYQSESFCIICMDGFYAGILTGQCSSCPKNCKSCAQQYYQYKDSWKWDIKAFYKYFVNSDGNRFLENFASNNQRQMEIICTSCPELYILYKQTCILDCAKDCQNCEIIEDNNGSCLKCPKYCSACVQRSQEEITRINPYFVQSSSNFESTQICYEIFNPPDNSNKYFIDTRLFSVNECKKFNKCQKIVTITQMVYCDPYDFGIIWHDPKFYNIKVYVLQFFKIPHTESVEIDNYLNKIQPSRIIYEFQFRLGNATNCQIDMQSYQVAVKNMQKIFSVQQIDIKFVGLKEYTKIQIISQIRIYNFTNIIFENIEFDFSSSSSPDGALIQLNNLNYNAKLTIKNCIFTTANNNMMFQSLFQSSHSYSAILENVLIKDLTITQSKLFSFNNLNQQNQIKVIIRNLQIIDSEFFLTTLFAFNASSNNFVNQVNIENLKISNCKFKKSVFIQSFRKQNFSIGEMQIKDIKIQNSIFKNSSLMYIENAKNLRIEKLQIDNLTLSQQSYLYLVNAIILIDSKFDKVKLYNYSKLIANQINLDLNLEEQQYTSISNLQIQNTEYDSIQSIINIKQQKKLELQNIQLYNNYLVSRLDFNEISFIQSSIYIECEVCILENIDVIRLYGLPEISIMETENVIMKNIKLIQNIEFHPLMLHSDYNCLSGFLNFEMSFFIYFGRYQNISIHNIKILESFTFNAPLLIFKGYDLLEKVQNESISIFYSKFEHNLLLIFREFSYSSILYFDSNQYSVIQIENSHFMNNHLNEYYQNQKMISATTFVVLQRTGTFNIKNSSLIKNIITNSSNSILYVQSDSVKIDNITFQQNNLLEYQDFNQNLLFSITNQQILFLDDLKNIFPVKSESGNGVFNTKIFIAENLLVNQSYAYLSGGFRLILKGQSFFVIEKSQFYQTRTTLTNLFYTQGGCLYIDALASSSLSFNFLNIQIDTSYSRTEGGGIYIIPSNYQNLINFTNLTIKNCFAIKNSFLSFQIQKLNSMISSFFLKNSKFIQEELGFNEFLRNLDDFTSTEAESIVLQNPLIYTRYGNITLANCSFLNTYSQFLIHIEEAENILLKNLRFIKSSIRKSPLIRLGLIEQGGLIKIQNVVFLQNYEIETITRIQCLSKNSIILQSKLQCPTNLFSSTKKKFHDQDNQNYLGNQFQCNLKLLNNKTDIQYSLMEILNVENIHFVQISGLKFEKNQCKGCYYGLLKVSKKETEMKKVLLIKFLDMLNNVCGYSGCFTILGNSFSSPFRQDLLQNRILLYSKVSNLKERINYEILIENSKFMNNIADYGGALMIVEAQSLILDCEFQFNSAKIGGAIYFFANFRLLCLIQSKITHNTAEIAGGIFLNNQSLMELHLFSVYLNENNSTRFGSDIVESPRSLSLIVNLGQILLEKKFIDESDSKIVEKIVVQPYKTFGHKNKIQFLTLPSGRPIGSYMYFDSYSLSNILYNLTFRIIPLNKFHKQIKGLDGHSCQITPVAINSSSNENVTDVFYALSYYSTLYNKETQDFNFDDLIIYFNPNYEESLLLRLIIECDFIQIPIYDKQPPYLIIDYIKNYQLYVDIKTFKCQIGEYLNVTSGGCVLCDSFQNEYQVTKDAQNCSSKDETKMKSIEPSKIELLPHYWRAYYYSSIIENCYHNEENCLGGWIPGEDSCILGHVGALCEQCDLYNSRGDGSFSVSQTYSCGSCDKIASNILSIILISLWTLISTWMSVSSTVQMMDEFIIGLKRRLFGFVVVIKTASTAILLKILTNYLQIISTISTFQLQIPGLQNIFNSISTPMVQMGYSLDCFLITISDIDIIYFRIIWNVLMIIFYIAVFILLGQFCRLINQINFSISHVSTAILYIFIFTQPNLIQGLISLLSYRVISNEYWVQGNVAYRYDTFNHLKWSVGFSLPQLIFFGIIMPFIFWYGLFKNRNNLDKIAVRKIWGYLYNEFKQKSYYWETIKILQKELIIIVQIYYDDYIPIKASLVFLILFSYSYSTQQLKPYTTGELNYLDSQSTIVCAVSIILGSSIYSAQNNDLQEIVWPFYLIIALLNLLFISQMVVKVCFAYFKKLSEKIDKVKEFIQKQFSSMLIFYPTINKFFELDRKKQTRIKQKYQKIRQALLPQIRKLLIYKRNNLIAFNKIDDRKEIQINSGDDHQILSFSCPKCQSSLIDQTDTNWYYQTLSPKMQENKKFIFQMIQQKNK